MAMSNTQSFLFALLHRPWRHLTPLALMLALLLPALFVTTLQAGERDMVTYIGGPKAQRFTDLVGLSDGTVLIAGSAQSLDWLPAGVPRTELDAGGIHSRSADRVAFLLHLSGDLQKPLRLITLPVGVVRDIRMIKTSNEPSQPTGVIYIAGPRDNGDPRQDGGESGYFIARLNGNFVDKAPTALEWVHNVAAMDLYQEEPRWDVAADGKVYFAAGEPFGKQWGAVYRLSAKGKLEVVNDWRFHLTAQGAWHGSPASQRDDVKYSGLSLAVDRRGSLRSWTKEDYEAKLSDGNGGVKQGLWPLDAFFAGPFDVADPRESEAGPGYTGCSMGPAKSLCVNGITVDRRTGDFYIALGIQTRLPNEKLDTEPAVIAMSSTGKLRWWSRLHTEQSDNSPSQQSATGLVIDYSDATGQGVLVVAASVYGEDKNNLWRGNEVKQPDNPGRSFQPRFDGALDNATIAWLGRLSLADGTLLQSTYIGEYAEGMAIRDDSQRYPDPHYDGWLNHDLGMADLATTRLGAHLRVDNQGRIYVVGYGRRVLTTADAFQKMLKPEQGLSSWAQFVRVYSPDLTRIVYSSLLTGQWDKKTGMGGDNTHLLGLWPVEGGVMLAGLQEVDDQGILKGRSIPTQNVPAWGRDQPAGEEAILARLRFE